ncbi:glycosyl transferase [Erwinia typographi]|uniref:Glycosyl transferase n=1 Tax=Erwinia typographi TaxID=371042 RepID=A0A0A3Z1T2_9GAMM|nr:glycosyltransferase family 8 protein [Erwinia typographi]KGT93022.1 glycosyl transferase [Erwinia typographi]
MKAWTTLLTQPGYLAGVQTLKKSLTQAGSAYPLVVMVTQNIDAKTRLTLEKEGCLLRDVQPISPNRTLKHNYANARFAEVWTKLAVWKLIEFERVVFLDADMLVTQNMDELFDLALEDQEIAACHACRCNPNKIPSYPKSWRPENCFYSYCRGLQHSEELEQVDNYLNGGFLVLRPDEAVFGEMVQQLSELEDLSRYLFAEQDFLNDFFHQRWKPLPYIYNALKTLPFQHAAMWEIDEVKNLHFIIDKPWEKPLDPNDRYYALNKMWWDTAKS